MIAKIMLSLLIAQAPLAGFVPAPSTGGTVTRLEANKNQKKVHKPNKKKGNQNQRRGNKWRANRQRHVPQVVTTSAKVVDEITLEERANDRLNAMVAASGDLAAKDNFEAQKKVREAKFAQLEGERQRLKQLLTEGRLNATQLNQLEADGFSVFHHVVMSGWDDIAGRMIDVGADPDVKDASGKSAREWARILNHTSMASLLDSKAPPKR